MRLVVTADDLGLSPAVSRGILAAHRTGVVRSTSLLVTFPAAAEAAALARDAEGLEIGLHLDLVGGRPAADPGTVRSLVDGDGRFHRLGAFTARLVTGRIRAAEVARELRAQVARARSWGLAVHAWDSHRHTHLMPPVARIVGALAREEGVRWLRRATPPGVPGALRPGALALASLAAAPLFRGIPGNDWYVDLSSWRPALDAAALTRLARRGGVGEIGSHPGEVDDELIAADSLVERRRDELALLTDPAFAAALRGTTLGPRVIA